MKMNDIMNFINEMSNHQGFYGRLYRDIIDLKNSEDENDNASYSEIVEELEAQNFNDTLDIVMYFES